MKGKKNIISSGDETFIDPLHFCFLFQLFHHELFEFFSHIMALFLVKYSSHSSFSFQISLYSKSIAVLAIRGITIAAGVLLLMPTDKVKVKMPNDVEYQNNTRE